MARSVVQAASVHLTPVTLELGGKCPCLIYGRINIQAAAHRLAWAKFFNMGQSCVAPDYVLCTEATRDALVPALSAVLEKFYGKELQKSPDLSRIVSDRHYNRLKKLLDRTKGKVVIGGESDQEDKYIGGPSDASVCQMFYRSYSSVDDKATDNLNARFLTFIYIKTFRFTLMVLLCVLEA